MNGKVLIKVTRRYLSGNKKMVKYKFGKYVFHLKSKNLYETLKIFKQTIGENGAPVYQYFYQDAIIYVHILPKYIDVHVYHEKPSENHEPCDKFVTNFFRENENDIIMNIRENIIQSI